MYILFLSVINGARIADSGLSVAVVFVPLLSLVNPAIDLYNTRAIWITN